MICPGCRNEIPHLALACPTCLERESRKILVEHQRQFLPGILQGVYVLTLAKPVGEPGWHIRLVGDARHAWCGQEISPQWKHRRYVRLTEEPGNLCPRCLEVFEGMVKELRSEVV